MNKAELIKALAELLAEKMEIGEEPTNGEMIQALFPKAKVFENENNVKYPYVDVFLYSENHMNCYGKDWWNAPYQRGNEE